MKLHSAMPQALSDFLIKWYPTCFAEHEWNLVKVEHLRWVFLNHANLLFRCTTCKIEKQILMRFCQYVGFEVLEVKR
jgi:hypothetical protein